MRSLRTCTGKDLRCEASILDANISLDSRLVVASSQSGEVFVFDSKTGSLKYTLRGHTRASRIGSFSPSGNLLVTFSDDHTAIVWNLKTARELFTFRGHTQPLNSAVFSPGGESILTASQDGKTYLWPVDPLPLALSTKPRELTEDERSRFEIE